LHNADLSSGLSPEHERVALEQPDGQRTFGENQAFWVHDEATGIHINGHLNTCEDIGVFAQRVAKLSIIFPDGRTYIVRETGARSDARTVASSNLSYECIEPFARWRCAFNGVMQDITIQRRYLSGQPLDIPDARQLRDGRNAPQARGEDHRSRSRTRGGSRASACRR